MGKNLEHNSGISIKNSHQGCMWSIFHVLHYHRWHHVKKVLPHKRHAGGRHDVGVENPESNINAAKAGKMQEHNQQIDTVMDNSLIEEKATGPSPVRKSSVKSRIKALIAEEMSKRRGRHRRSCSLPVQSFSHPVQTQETHTNSIHHLEASNIDPLAEVASDDENPKLVHQENKNSSVASTSDLDQLQSRVRETPVASSEKCDLCATMLAMNYLRQSQVGEHGKQSVENHTLLEDKLIKTKQDLAQKLIYAKEPSKEVSLHMFNINKELFLKILQDRSSPLRHNFHGRRAFNTNRGLTKSVSFPLDGSLCRRDVAPNKLKHKQKTESWTEEEGKLQVGNQEKKFTELESREDTSERSVPLIAEHRVDGIPKPHLEMSRSFGNSSPGSPQEVKNQRENKMVIKHFKNLRQKIKHAIRESRKERHRITMDAVLHKIPHGRKLSKDVKKKDDLQKEQAMGKCSNCSPKSCCESIQSLSALSKGGLQHIKRTSSFKESLDRYCQLYESSFNREARHHISERLKMRIEEMPSPVRNAQKSLGRILSLPDLSSFSYLQSEGSPNAMSIGTPSRTAANSIVSRGTNRFDEQKSLGLPIRSKNETPVDAPVENGSQENSVEVGESYPVMKDEVGSTSLTTDEAKSKVGETLDILCNLTAGVSSHNKHEICPTAGATVKLGGPGPISMLDSNFQEDITSPAKFSISEDLGSKPNGLFFGVESFDSFTNEQCEVGMDSLTVAKSRVHHEEMETPIKQSNSYFPHFLVDANDISEFNYVRDVLELSGFSRKEFLGTWHSADQPVGPSVFDEVEGFLLPEPNCSENEEGGYCNHLLLFDLINEILLEIHESSFTYWPMPLSSCSHIRPMPVGYHVLEEVWSNISRYLTWRTKVEPSLDDAVSRDLAKGDGWMNLQLDAECVVLEVEDMIFDDLLEEMVFDDLLEELKWT